MSASGTLTSRSVRSFGWEAVARGVQQSFALLSTAVLARLLAPAAYGVMGMAALFVNFASTLNQLGIPAAIVQRSDIDDDMLSSLFWLNVLFGATLTLIMIAVAPLAATFFSEPAVASILPVLALTFVLDTLGAVQHALFYREMNLRPPAISQLVASASGLAVAIVLAFRGAGVWSLVAATLTAKIADVLLMWSLHPWRPRVRVRWAHFRSVARFGLSLAGFGMVNFFSRNGDNLIVGRLLGPAPLGYYQNAYSLMFYPQQVITGLLTSVTLAPLSRLQNEDSRFRGAVLSLSSVLGFVLFPAMLGLAVTADLVVRVVLGPRWDAAVPVLATLALAGFLQASLAATGQMFTAKGRPDMLLKLSLFAATTNICAFLVGARWGVGGVAAGYVVSTAILLFPQLLLALRLVRLPFGEYAKALAPVIAISLAMAATVVAYRLGMGALGIGNPWFLCFTSVALGALAYTVLMLAIWPRVMGSITDILRGSGVAFLQRVGGAALGLRRPAAPTDGNVP